MRNMQDVTYQCRLDALDASAAQFVAGETGCELRLPRDEWEQMGRPGTVYVTPQVEFEAAR